MKEAPPSLPCSCAARHALAAIACMIAGAACGDGIGTPIRRAALDDGDASIDVVDASVDTAPDAAAPGTGGFGGRGLPQDPRWDDVPLNSYCAGVADWPEGWAERELAMYAMIMQLRSFDEFQCQGQTYRDLTPLDLLPALRCSARVHSLDMARHNYRSTRDQQGVEPPMRMVAAGLESIRDSGELIENGRDPQNALMDLVRDHSFACQHLGSQRFDAIGIGYAEADDRQGGEEGLWTIDFAQR